MSEASYASLSPKLLANKGGAKPAMRSQMAGFEKSAMFPDQNLEDLGWNDMGEASDDAARDAANSDPAPVMGEVISLNDHLHAQDRANKPRDAAHTPSQSALAKKHQQTAVIKSGKRAAFTLRLDSTRHLKLKLAATMLDMSAQQIVTDALDAALSAMPELDQMAARIKRT